MRIKDTSLKLKPRMLELMNPCPVCGVETTLAEIEPHPLHVNFEIHGYLCDRCGPTKSLVVLRTATSNDDVSPILAPSIQMARCRQLARPTQSL